MKVRIPLFFLTLILLIVACDRELEENPIDNGYDYQPLEVGSYWIYSVDQTLYFGENDFEEESFFQRDLISTFYTNEENEQVYIVERSKSYDQNDWEKLEEFTLLIRKNTLIRTVQNQSSVVLVFPPNEGTKWNATIYQNVQEDEFEIKTVPDDPQRLLVDQKDSDDLVTFRDIRYEVFEKGIGLVEDYEEVLTYCSRNDCLGDMLIDGGVKKHMVLTEYGK